MRLLLSTALAFLITTNLLCQVECDYDIIDGFEYSGYFNGSHYYLSNSSLTWIESNVVCNELGGHLATVNSEEENQFISNINANTTVWIGLIQNTESDDYNEPDGGWEWVTGEPYEYTSWGASKPGDSGPAGPENHGEMGLSGSGNWYGLWNDADGTYHIEPFVLEIECPLVGLGCTYKSACNYDPEAVENDGSCLFVGDSCDDSDESTVNDIFQGDCICSGYSIYGCTYSSACNFSSYATEDDDSCFFIGDSCDDEDPETTDDVIQEDCECVGEIHILVSELEAFSVLTYPNPASNNLTIDLGALTGLNTMIKLYDSSSKLVFEKQSTSTLIIDVSVYAKGLYTLELSTFDKVLRSQVVIE